MKILFLANPHAGLYKEIAAELERQNHETAVIEDKYLRFDPFYRSIHFQKLKQILFVDIYNIHNHYWNKMIATDSRLNESYDVLLVLGGTSIGERLINHLQSINPSIKKILYTWDDCNYYAYDRLLKWFDRGYSFDIKNVRKDARWRLLPIYCKDPNLKISSEPIYDIFSIGTNHDDRLIFLYKILPKLKEMELSYCIKVIELQKKLSKKEYVKFFFCRFFKFKYYSNDMLRMEYILDNTDTYGIKQNEYISQVQYNDLISKSVCLLDDQRSSQAGLTAKFMWALANKKKIITTNQWAYEYSFVNSKQVQIIDKYDPVISKDFVKAPLEEDGFSDVTPFYIQSWVKELLSIAVQ